MVKPVVLLWLIITVFTSSSFVQCPNKPCLASNFFTGAQSKQNW